MTTATTWNLPNFTGELYLIGANQTPFLNIIGGLEGGNVRTVGAFDFPTAQPWALNGASQPNISESASATAPAADVYVRQQEMNCVQIFQKSVDVTYAKQSATGAVLVNAALQAGYENVDVTEKQPVQDEKSFQIAAVLRQIAVDVEHTFLNGVYQTPGDVNTAHRSRGILTLLDSTSSEVKAGSTYLDRQLLNKLLRQMAAAGAEFRNPVLFCNAFQKQKLSEIFGYAPEDRFVGGVAVSEIYTDFAKLAVVWAPYVPTTKLLIADVDVCRPVFLPVPGKGVLFYEDLGKVGAVEKGMIYGQIGLDHGPREFHGCITGLKDA